MLHTAIIVAALAAAPPCADFDRSGAVGVPDLMHLLGEWGPCDGCACDLDQNGAVGVPDLLLTLEQFGKECVPMSAPAAAGALYIENDSTSNGRQAIIAPYTDDSSPVTPIPADLFDNDFSVCSWVKRTAVGSFSFCVAIADADDNPIVRFRLSTATMNNIRFTNAAGTNTDIGSGSSFERSQENLWALRCYDWTASTGTLRVRSVGLNNSDEAELVQAGGTPGGTFRVPAKFYLLSTGSHQIGQFGCGALRLRTFSDADLLAMFNSRHGQAPMIFDNEDLSEVGMIAWNYGIVQFPTAAGDGHSASTGARIGSTVVPGNYLVSMGGSRITTRPVTVTNSPVYAYDESGFFEAHIESNVESGTVGNSPVLKRWAANTPSGQERICLAGNSRAVRQLSYSPAAGSPDVPFAYAASWNNGFSLHHLDSFAGMVGARIRLGTTLRVPGIDIDANVFTDGAANELSAGHDIAREWLHSTSAGGPSHPILLGNDGELSVGGKHLDGSLLDKAEPWIVGLTYLRGPGCSDFVYQGTEATGQGVKGTLVGTEQATDDANTTVFTHDFNTGTGDSYNAGTKTLALRTSQLQGTPVAGQRVAIVAGTGAGAFAEIEAVNVGGSTTDLTLRHAFSDAPVSGSSVFAFGPVSYGFASIEIAATDDDYKKVWAKHDGAVATNELGAVILSASVYRASGDGFIWAATGWGGNGFKPQMDATNSDVITRMVAHLDLDLVLLTDSYQSTTISIHFPQYAALCEAGGAAAAYMIGQSNTSDGSQESTYRSFAFGQSDRPAVCVTDSPIIGSQIAQTAYSGLQNTSHPSIETFANVAAATAGLASVEFHEVATSPCVSVPNVTGTYLGAIRVTVGEGLTLEHGINGNERYDVKITDGESTVLETSFDLGDGSLAEMIAYLQGQLAENEVEGVTLALGDAYEPDTPATVLQEQWSVAEVQPAGTYWLVGDEACTPAGAGVSAIPSELVSGLGLGVIDD